MFIGFILKQGWTSQNTYPRSCFDMDGDGYADLVGFANNGVYVAYSDGNTFGTPNFVLNSFGTNAGGWSSFDLYPRCLGIYKKSGSTSPGSPTQYQSSSSSESGSIIGFGNAGVYKSDYVSSSSFSTPTLVLNSFAVSAGGY